MKIFYVVCISALAWLLPVISVGVATASSVIDTTTAWTGQGVAPLGGNGVSAYGQSFVAPDDPVLHHVTLYLNEHLPPYLPINYQVVLTRWYL